MKIIKRLIPLILVIAIILQIPISAAQKPKGYNISYINGKYYVSPSGSIYNNDYINLVKNNKSLAITGMGIPFVAPVIEAVTAMLALAGVTFTENTNFNISNGIAGFLDANPSLRDAILLSNTTSPIGQLFYVTSDMMNKLLSAVQSYFQISTPNLITKIPSMVQYEESIIIYDNTQVTKPLRTIPVKIYAGNHKYKLKSLTSMDNYSLYTEVMCEYKKITAETTKIESYIGGGSQKSILNTVTYTPQKLYDDGDGLGSYSYYNFRMHETHSPGIHHTATLQLYAQESGIRGPADPVAYWVLGQAVLGPSQYTTSALQYYKTYDYGSNQIIYYPPSLSSTGTQKVALYDTQNEVPYEYKQQISNQKLLDVAEANVEGIPLNLDSDLNAVKDKTLSQLTTQEIADQLTGVTQLEVPAQELSFWDSVTAGFNSVIDWFQSLWQAIVDGFNAIYIYTLTITDCITAGFASAGATLSEIFGQLADIYDLIKKFFIDYGESFLDFEGLLQSLEDFISSVSAKIQVFISYMTGTSSFILNLFNSMPDPIKNSLIAAIVLSIFGGIVAVLL